MDWSYSDSDREAIYRVIAERRDIRTGFLPDEIPDEVLTRVLGAAHAGPSVGMAQPWDFVLVRSPAQRVRLQELVSRTQAEFAESLPPSRAAVFARLRIDAIERAPLCVVVTCDATRGGWYTLGTPDESEPLVRSVGYAIENLWLAARAEGVGVCFVAAFDVAEMGRVLGLPGNLEVIACLCLGYVERFPVRPGLAYTGWVRGRPLAWVIHHEVFGQRGLPGRAPVHLLEETIAGFPTLEAADPTGAADVVSAVMSLTGPRTLPPYGVLALFAADTDFSCGRAGPAVREFLGGGAGERLMSMTGVEACVVDVGVRESLPRLSGLLSRKPANGPARLGRDDMVQAVETGIEMARDYYATGHGWLVGDVLDGDDGCAVAVLARLMNCAPEAFAALDEPGARAAADRRSGEAEGDPLEILAACGGLAIASLAGFILGARAVRAPVLLAGPAAAAAALTACALAPDAAAACFPVAEIPSGVPDPYRFLGRPVPSLRSRDGLSGPGAAAAVLPALRAAVEEHEQTAELSATTGTGQ
ncbi:5,6-dimethylbenzimidazole synthase [Actinosynnema sp. NPDC004786]